MNNINCREKTGSYGEMAEVVTWIDVQSAPVSGLLQKSCEWSDLASFSFDIY